MRKPTVLEIIVMGLAVLVALILLAGIFRLVGPGLYEAAAIANPFALIGVVWMNLRRKKK